MTQMGGSVFEIRDVVYGFIQLDEQEWDIINHPVYQRLRRIKQLSLTDMAYPGAVHTRLEHSIGVMQMATDIYNSIISKRRARALLSEQYYLDAGGFDRYRKVIRLAALLHDIGHSPFSHTGENLMPLKKASDGKRYEHEEYSIAIIKTYFREIIEEHPINANYKISVEEVTALLGDPTKCAFQGILLLFKGIISGQLDADRADYLLRDSIHTGVDYGLYDKNRLINCIDIGQMPDTDALVLAVQDGGWHIAESLVLARYQMFSQVYFHKTRRAYDYHVGCAVKSILDTCYPKLGGCYPTPDNLDDYVQFDDWTMYGKIKEGYGGKHGQIIIDRNHYRKVYETSLLPTIEEETELEKLEKELEEKGTVDFFEDEAKTKWYKLDKDILISDERTGYVKELSRISPIVRHMVNAPRMKRLYVEKQ